MLVELKSVGCMFDDKTLLSYPMFSEVGQQMYNKVYDDTNPTHLNDCNDEWYENLDDHDTLVVNNFVLF